MNDLLVVLVVPRDGVESAVDWQTLSRMCLRAAHERIDTVAARMTRLRRHVQVCRPSHRRFHEVKRAHEQRSDWHC